MFVMDDMREFIPGYQKIMSEFKEEIMAEAEEARARKMALPGTAGKKVFVGNPPKWNENPYGVGGYSWMLCRMDYLAVMCQAWLLTGDGAWLDEVYRDLEDWMKNAAVPPVPSDEKTLIPYHGDRNWRMLETGYRMVNSFRIIMPVLEYAGADAVWLTRLKELVIAHGERIYAGSHLLWPNADHNHYMEEITGLLCCCRYLQGSPEEKKWLGRAKEGFERAVKAQISDGGAQVEGAVSYHNHTMRSVLIGTLTLQRLGCPVSEELEKRIKRGVDFSVQMVRPNGTLVPFGDSKEETSVNCAVRGYLMFGERKWIDAVRKTASPECIKKAAAVHCWGYPNLDRLLALLKEEAGPVDLPLVNYQDTVQQVYMRTSWERDALCLAMTCKTPVHYGNHGHIDPLGIDFSAYGKELLIDPGRLDYKEGEIRYLYKSSSFHNLPTINGRDAFVYADTFHYGEQKEGRITKVLQTDGLLCANAYHMNYEPVRTERFAAIVGKKYLVLADHFIGGKGQIARIYFHFASENAEETDGVVTAKGDGVSLALYSSITDKIDLLDGRSYDYRRSSRAAYTRILESDEETVVTVGAPYCGDCSPVIKDIKVEAGIISFRDQEMEYKIDYNNVMETAAVNSN